MLTCKSCGKPVDRNDAHFEDSIFPYCPECTSPCSECGKDVANEKLVFDGDTPFCEECYHDLFETCPNCHGIFRKDEMTQTGDDGLVCEDCINDDYISCDECGEFYHRNDINRIGDGYYCNECTDNNFNQCRNCHEFIRDNETCCLTDGTPYCEECYNDVSCECSNCQDVVHYRETTFINNLDINVCNYCYDHSYASCRECGDTEHNDDLEEGLCENCREESSIDNSSYQNVEVIESNGRFFPNIYQRKSGFHYDLFHSYSFKPNPIFHKVSDKDDVFMFGLELECECNDNRSDVVKEISILSPVLFYCKSDGSLSQDDGLEICSHPMSWEYYQKHGKEQFINLIRLLNRMGCKAWDVPSSCTKCIGIHVSIASNAFTTLHTFKFLKFFYEYEDFIWKISRRRTMDEMWRYAECGKKDLHECIKQVKNKFEMNRYTAVNLNNPNRYEVRIFRSTLKLESFLAYIEFCKASYEFTKDAGISEISPEKFYQFVCDKKETSKRFKNLVDMLFKLSLV